jgi:hypothetical protein
MLTSLVATHGNKKYLGFRNVIVLKLSVHPLSCNMMKLLVSKQMGTVGKYHPCQSKKSSNFKLELEDKSTF